MIRIIVDDSEDIPDERLFSVDCLIPNCGWSGDLPFSDIYKLPM
jgi:hypothetical protein